MKSYSHTCTVALDDALFILFPDVSTQQLLQVKLLSITSSLTMGVFGTVKEIVQASFLQTVGGIGRVNLDDARWHTLTHVLRVSWCDV